MFSIQIFLVSTNTTISYFSSYFLIATVICFVFLEVNATISCFQHNCYFLIATVICFIFLEVNATISCFRQNDGGTNSLLCPFFPIIRHQLQCLFYNLFLVCLSFLFYTFYCSLTSMFATVFAPLLCSLHFIGSPFFTIICSLYFPLFCTLYLYTALKYTFWWLLILNY